MKRYLIERNIPGVDKLNREQLKGAAGTSNDALASRYVNDQSTRPAADVLLASPSASIMSGGGS